jgi:hypothetical protein
MNTSLELKTAAKNDKENQPINHVEILNMQLDSLQVSKSFNMVII